eukprot:9978962-Heterocapsa_arctica.AAC.1
MGKATGREEVTRHTGKKTHPGKNKTQVRYCRTCGMEFMAIPEGGSGYMHKNCCSQCTYTG